MSRICDFIIQKEELNTGEKAEIRDEQEKDLAYQKWLDSRESENEHELAESQNNGILF